MAEIKYKYLNLEGLTEFKRLLDIKLLSDKQELIGIINPIMEDIGEGVLTIKRNNTTIEQFSANSQDDVEVNIEVPEKLGNLTNVVNDIKNIVEYGQIDVSDLTDEQKESLKESQAAIFDYVTSKVLRENLSGFANKIKYDTSDSDNPQIQLINHSEEEDQVLSSFSAKDFILDGMLQNVEIKDYDYGTIEEPNIKKSIVFTFNIEISGSTEIAIPLDDVFDSDAYYTKSEIEGILEGIETTPGADGKSAYEIAQDNGFTGTEQEWLLSLKGADGTQGVDGKSAYQSYLDTTLDDPKLSESEWLESLIGPTGDPGEDGLTPHIDQETGNWFIGAINTGVLAQGTNGQNGADGKSAYEIYADTTENPMSQSEWLESLKGINGQNGITPHIDSTTGNWFIGEINTGIHAEGPVGQNGNDGINGITPSIDPITKHWLIGETDTNIVAEGIDGNNGVDGITPHIDSTTKHWIIGNTDTNILAEGQSGADGITPHINSTTGNWFIGETNTGISAQGPQGVQGNSAYQVAVNNGFEGTEQEWLQSLQGKDGTSVKILENAEACTNLGDGYINSNGHLMVLIELPDIFEDVGEIKGPKGDNGKSAYQSYLDTTSDNPVLSEEEWASSRSKVTEITYGTTEELDTTKQIDSLFENIL